MESRRTHVKPKQHQTSDGPMTSTVKKNGATFLPTRDMGQPSNSDSPIPHTSRLSFANMSKPKQRKATKYFLLISEAIEAIGDEKKGASVQAIKKWILGNYLEIPQRSFNIKVNSALTRGLDDGLLERPKRSKIARGAFGFFLLAKKDENPKKTSKPPKVKAAVLLEAYSSDTELTFNRGRAMSLRLNLSDTELTEVRKSLVFKANIKKRKGTPAAKKVVGEDKKEQGNFGHNGHVKRLGGRSVKKVVADSSDEDSNEVLEQKKQRNFDHNVHVKRLGGKSVKKVVAESDDEDSNKDSLQEKQIQPTVKAQTKKPTKASKAAGIKTADKPPRKAPSSKTKDIKENVPPKPKRKPKK